MTLAALQSSFQAAILGETSEILEAVTPSRRLDSASRFAVYAEAYRSRLADFVANDYPALHQILGDEHFFNLAAAYIDATPSRHRNARFYARDLPEFMRVQVPWASSPILADLAALERALADAFDAADADAVDAAALADIPAKAQPQLSLKFAPCVAALTVTRGTATCYAAALEGWAMDMPRDEGRETILVWRSAALEPLYRLLEEDETLALDAARQGGSLDNICGLLSLRHDADATAGLVGQILARWLGDGLVISLACR